MTEEAAPAILTIHIWDLYLTEHLKPFRLAIPVYENGSSDFHGSVVTYPEFGEQFVRILLRTVFGKEFKHLSVTAQKVYYGTDVGLHGARLDVYMEAKEEEDPEERATVYDMEPDRKDSAADKKALPRRMRFYHGKIVARSLNAGIDYDELKDVVIIMILPFDPFGLDRMVYTVRNRCVEEPDMAYEDGAGTLFLYTKGTKEVPNEALRQLLCYMENSVSENAVNDDLREIHRIVEIVKKDPEMSIGYWSFLEELNRCKKEGDQQRLISQVCKKMKKEKLLEEIAEDLEEEVSVIEPIYNAAKEFAPEYDPKAVFERMKTYE